MAAKETDKLSEELAQIERDIQTKEQQFLVSNIFGIDLKYLHKYYNKSCLTCIGNCCSSKNFLFIQNNTTNNLDYFVLGLRLTVPIKKFLAFCV